MTEKEKNKESNQKKFDLQDLFIDYVLYAYNHYALIFSLATNTHFQAGAWKRDSCIRKKQVNIFYFKSIDTAKKKNE